MHYGLVIVGAHDGEKSSEWVETAANHGNVLLIEPVPFLYERLRKRYWYHPNVTCRNVAIADINGTIEFNAPVETTNETIPGGDQWGSLLSGHAVAHDSRMVGNIKTIKVWADTFESMIEATGTTGIDVLLTDMEGMDAKLLLSFPFHKIRPKQIMFEFKHADGFMKVGKTLAALLIALDALGYLTRPLDHESFLATMET